MSIVMSSNSHNQKSFFTASISQFLSSVLSSSLSSSQTCTASSSNSRSPKESATYLVQQQACENNHGISNTNVGFSPSSQLSSSKCKESKVLSESLARLPKSGLNQSGGTSAVVVGRNWLLLGVLVILLVLDHPRHVFSSEFPERECCDPVYPIATSTSAPVPSAITVPAGGKTGKILKLSV